MDLKDELAKVQAKQKDLLNQIRGLDSAKQNLLQEALRLDGEIRAIQRLAVPVSQEAKP